jgi:hypothetical protein
MSTEHFRSFAPVSISPHLRDMFLSNTRAILGHLVHEHTGVAATA